MRKTIMVLAIIIALTYLIRIINLTLLPVFADEAIYIRWSQIMASEPTLRFLPLSDGKQPLYMWVLMTVVDKFNDPLFIGRFISVLCGVGTTVGIFLAAYYLFKSKLAAALSALFWAISPFAVFFDRMALTDSMLTMFGVWTFLGSVVVVKTQRLDAAILTGFALGFASLTKSPALFFALLIPAAWMLADFSKDASRRKIQLLKLASLTLIIWILAYGMYSIQRLGPNFHLIAQRNLDYVYPYSRIITSPADPFVGHFKGILSYFVILAPLGLGLLAVTGVLTNIKKYPREILTVLAWAVIPTLLIAEYSQVVSARYLLYVMPFFVLLAASAFVGNRYKKVVLLLLVFFVLQSLLTDVKYLTDVSAAPLPYGDRSGYLEEWTAGQGIKEISEFVKAQHQKDPATKIVIGTEGYFGTLPDGLQMYLQPVDNVITIGVGLGFTDLPQSLKESKNAGNKTYLVINKSRLIADPKKLGLKLIKEYPKLPRRIDSREYKLMGPQETLYFFEVGK